MESGWQHRGHPPHDPSAPSVLPTLPSVAELLASSRPTSDSIPAYQHPSASSRQHLSRSTPPNAPALSTSANASSSADHSHSSVFNYTNQASPTESATSTSPSEPQHYQSLNTHQSSVVPFGPTSTSATGPSLGALHSQPPTNARRQDSAYQRIESPKEGSSFAPSSESNFVYSNRSPSDNYPQPSPGSVSHPHSHTSFPLNHHSASTSRSHEQGHAQIGTDSASRSSGSSQPQDHTSSNNSRQQRYNVRFATNHTIENMLPSQKSRQSPPLPTPPAQVDAVNSPPVTPEAAVPPIIEPAIRAITRSCQPSEDQLQSEERHQELSAERCPVCNETYRRPLPEFNASATDSNKPQGSSMDMDVGTGMLGIIDRLRKHGKDADADYAQWKAHHERCSRNRPSSSPRPPTSLPPNDRPSNGQSRANAQPEVVSNKRKPEDSHGDRQKLRKVAFDADTSAAPVPATT
ncbi:hypothetical protein EK21DRAFT_110604 [Setomelanomma holmii]|uniref:Uncharacterized protein n=1 Tax=Setomelanomma holmii TaxID=210430 RepID=A0A9P4LPG4_9PLEO|nr:hypothetical protein EK21DRAFT_110604 [Setomelanomma holmii]